MQDLRVTVVQTPLHWEGATANRAMIEEKLSSLSHDTDLIILPEMFTTGFTMNAPRFSEPMNLTTFKWMKQQAANHQAVVTGSYIVKDNGKYYNRLLWMEPNGHYDYYDKRHLFRMSEEHKVYTAGEKRIIKNLKGWKICPLICYDLRFPVWSRNQADLYDLLLYVANWPQARQQAWEVLLKARAIENICYVAGVNRIGTDGNGIIYQGNSAILNFKGEPILQAGSEDVVRTSALSYQDLTEFRVKFPAHLDADPFKIGFTDAKETANDVPPG